MKEGTVVKLYAEDGDYVIADQMLALIACQDADIEIVAPKAGKLALHDSLKKGAVVDADMLDSFYGVVPVEGLEMFKIPRKTYLWFQFAAFWASWMIYSNYKLADPIQLALIYFVLAVFSLLGMHKLERQFNYFYLEKFEMFFARQK